MPSAASPQAAPVSTRQVGGRFLLRTPAWYVLAFTALAALGVVILAVAFFSPSSQAKGIMTAVAIGFIVLGATGAFTKLALPPTRLAAGLFAAAGLIASLQVAALAMVGTTRWAEGRWTDTALESLIPATASLVGLIVFGCLLALLFVLPKRWAQAQLAGRASAAGVAATIWFGALTLLVLPLANALFDPFGWSAGSAALVAFVLLAAYAALRIEFSRPASSTSLPLLVLLVDNVWQRRQLGRLARSWTKGPITFLAPPECAAVVRATHSFVANAAGSLRTLFPRTLPDLDAYHRQLPGARQWTALPIREWYPPPSLWPDAIRGLITAETRILILLDSTRPLDAGWEGPLEELRRVLPPERTKVLVAGSGECPKALIRFQSSVLDDDALSGLREEAFLQSRQQGETRGGGGARDSEDGSLRLQRSAQLRYDERDRLSAGSGDLAVDDPEDQVGPAAHMLQALREAKVSVLRWPPHLTRDPLYAIPWYLFIGDAHSGARELLKAAKRYSPFLLPERSESPNQYWHWWTFRNMVAIELDERLVCEITDRVARDIWYQALQQLYAERSGMPINGIAVLVAADRLLGDQDELCDYALTIRRLLDECREHLHVAAPMYMLITGCERLPGFEQFVKILPADVARQAVGHRFEKIERANASTWQEFPGIFSSLYRRLHAIRIAGIRAERDQATRKGIWDFVEAFARLEPGLGQVAKLLLADSPFQHTPQWRGLYFTSAAGNGAFVEDLFTRFLPADQPLARRTRRPGLKGWLRSSASLLLILVVGALVIPMQ